jgi:hypothetical protein
LNISELHNDITTQRAQPEGYTEHRHPQRERGTERDTDLLTHREPDLVRQTDTELFTHRDTHEV